MSGKLLAGCTWFFTTYIWSGASLSGLPTCSWGGAFVKSGFCGFFFYQFQLRHGATHVAALKSNEHEFLFSMYRHTLRWTLAVWGFDHTGVIKLWNVHRNPNIWNSGLSPPRPWVSSMTSVPFCFRFVEARNRTRGSNFYLGLPFSVTPNQWRAPLTLHGPFPTSNIQ